MRLSRIPAALCLAFAALIVSAQPRPNSITFEEGEEGWMLLFYGSSLDDWTPSGDAEWRVENGAIVSDAGGSGRLLTIDEYENFEMVVDVLAEPGAEGGLLLRAPAEPGDPAIRSYALSLSPSDPEAPIGSLIGREKAAAVEPLEDWRHVHVEVFRGRITVKVDFETVLDWEDDDPLPSGFVALWRESGRLQFRNVKLRYL